VHVACHLVLPHQSLTKQQRVIRPERHRHARLHERPYRDHIQARLDPERDVRRRAHLTGDASGRQALQECRVLHRAHSVAEAGRVQLVQGRDDAVRADELPGVRHQEQPGTLGDREGALEILRGTPALVVG
jgi:hypothetical protein